MKVLVTGGGGFIGSHLVDRLLEDGHEVRVLDSFVTGHRHNLARLAEVELVEGDIQSFERAATAARGCDVILHQAALPSVPRSVQDPLMTNMVNVTGTLNVLLAARDHGVKRVISASSSSIYGANPALPKVETMPTAPMSPYAVSKQAAESYCRAFHDVYGLETISLRYFNVFGPRQDPNSQYAAVIPKFILAALRDEAVPVNGDGEQSRDFTYVENVVEANLLAMAAPAATGQAYNIACGDRVSLNAIIETLGELLDVQVRAEHRPPRIGDVRHSLADISLARQELGFEPAVELREGLRRTIEHFSRREAASVA